LLRHFADERWTVKAARQRPAYQIKVTTTRRITQAAYAMSIMGHKRKQILAFKIARLFNECTPKLSGSK
jgi:hypothetical protein